MKLIKTLFAVAATSLLTAGAAIADMAPQLQGYCPVAYLAVDKALKGSAEFSAKHDDKLYYFVNADALKAFNESPEKFLPQYDGFCAYGMSLGKTFESDPTVYTIVDGKVYLNKDAEIGKLFAKDTASHIAKADAAWPKVMKAEMMKKEKMKK